MTSLKSIIFIIIFLIAIILIQKSSCEECFYSMSCSKNSLNNCVDISQTEAINFYKITFSPCNNQRTLMCNVYESIIDIKSTSKAQCHPRPKQYKSYIGGLCTADDDCIYGKCFNNICSDAKENEECLNDENCPIGTSCIYDSLMQISTCQKPFTINQKCIKSTDCAFNLLCFDNKCIEMYSKESGTIMSERQLVLKEKDLICKSGQGIMLSSNYMFQCMTLYNFKRVFSDKCIEDCVYVYDNNKQIQIPKSCKCGFNYQRSKHCKLGSGEDAYVAFIQAKKDLWNDPIYMKHCHIIEKFSNDICAEYLNKERSLIGRRRIQSYNNLKIEALEHHSLMNADDCIKTVVYDYNTLAIIPHQQKCAAYTCDNHLTTCASGKNPLNEDGKNIKVILNDAFCQGDQICVFPDNDKIDSIYENENIIGQCKANEMNNLIRLPGEECEKGNECISSKCNMNEHKCEGKKVNEECKDHKECMVGLSCWKGNCQKQKKEGEECKTGWDCLNYLGCYSNLGSTESRCTKLGLVGDIDVSQIKLKWTIFPEIHINYDPSIIGTSLMCRNGQLSVSETRCGEYYYDTDVEAMKHENEDHFIECQFGSYCHYKDNYDKVIVKECECGYNSEGKGYCPLPNSINKEDWLKLNKIKQELTDNNCHTLSRFNCYSNPKASDISELEFRTTKGHLFYDAVPCAYKVLSSNLIHFSYSAIIILILFLY